MKVHNTPTVSTEAHTAYCIQITSMEGGLRVGLYNVAKVV